MIRYIPPAIPLRCYWLLLVGMGGKSCASVLSVTHLVHQLPLDMGLRTEPSGQPGLEGHATMTKQREPSSGDACASLCSWCCLMSAWLAGWRVGEPVGGRACGWAGMRAGGWVDGLVGGWSGGPVCMWVVGWVGGWVGGWAGEWVGGAVGGAVGGGERLGGPTHCNWPPGSNTPTIGVELNRSGMLQPIGPTARNSPHTYSRPGSEKVNSSIRLTLVGVKT